MRTALGAAAGFALLTVLVAARAFDALDRDVLAAAQSFASPPLDLLGSLVTVLGQTEVAGTLALALAVVWWRHRGVRGLVPLLLFAGVALELVLKLVVPHPGPPSGLDRDLELLPFVEAPTPSSFPSGHVLRTTFLAVLLGTGASAAWRVALGGLVLAAMLSRVYLAQHWLSDGFGGLLLGMALAALAVELRDRPAPASANGRR